VCVYVGLDYIVVINLSEINFKEEICVFYSVRRQFIIIFSIYLFIRINLRSYIVKYINLVNNTVFVIYDLIFHFEYNNLNTFSIVTV